MAGCRTNKEVTSNAAEGEDEGMWIVTLGLGRWKSEKFMIHKTLGKCILTSHFRHFSHVLFISISFLFCSIHSSQREIAMIAEMIHTASLIHDDVIDSSNTRRGKATVDSMWGQKKVSNILHIHIENIVIYCHSGRGRHVYDQ